MKVLTFSRFFPKGHPRQGQPTVFVPKIWACPGITITDSGWDLPEMKQFSPLTTLDHPKGHTIRAGNRWKVGDMASLRVWSDKPYRSKQIEFAQVEVKKVWRVEINSRFGAASFEVVINGKIYGQLHYGNDKDFNNAGIVTLSENDGLEVEDFISWFAIHPKKKEQEFSGQIIAWNENINY